MSVHYSTGCYLLQVVLVALVVSTADVASAKRGCASFGHSCFGGHGKRSSPDYPDISPAVAGAGEDYFSAGSLPPLSSRNDFPFAGLKTRSMDYGFPSDMTLDARASNWTPLLSILTGNTGNKLRPEDWMRSQQLLTGSMDLSPVLRQMMRSYRQHPLKFVK